MATKVASKKSAEEMVSMFLGLVIVMVVFGLVVNFFQKRKGSISVPGVETAIDSEVEESEVENVNVGGIYKVEQGDNLWKIAEKQYKSGYKWVDIAKENNLTNPGVLAVGQELKLPELAVEAGEEVSAEVSVEEGSYVVVRGDSLWKIAVNTYGDGYAWTEIWQANKNVLNNPGLLEIGMNLVLPQK